MIMKLNWLKILLITAVLTFTAGVASASDLVQKPETPPGQLKKSETAPELKVKTAPPAVKNGKPEVKPKEVTDFLAKKVRTEATVSAKLGAGKIKDLIKNASASGDLTVGGVRVRVREMIRREATPGAVMKRHAISGVITGLGDSRIIISHQTQRERVNTVYYNEATLVKIKDNPAATTADLAIGQRIAASGEVVDGTLLARRIHVIPGRGTGLMEKNPIATSGGVLNATPSATPSIVASPSATPVLEPTVTITPSASPTATPGT